MGRVLGEGGIAHSPINELAYGTLSRTACAEYEVVSLSCIYTLFRVFVFR